MLGLDFLDALQQKSMNINFLTINFNFFELNFQKINKVIKSSFQAKNLNIFIIM